MFFHDLDTYPHIIHKIKTDEATNDRAFLLLDPGLIVFAIGPRSGDLQTVLATPGDDRLVHEQAIIVKVDPAQWKGEQRHCRSRRSIGSPSLRPW